MLNDLVLNYGHWIVLGMQALGFVWIYNESRVSGRDVTKLLKICLRDSDEG